MQLLDQQRGFTLIEITISIAILAIITALAIPALGNLLSRNYARTAATFFQDDLRQARYEARTRSNNVVTFCAARNSLIGNTDCDDTNLDYTHGWLWFFVDSSGSRVLLGKNNAAEKSDVIVTLTHNFLIQMRKNNTSLRDDNDNEISIPDGPVYPTITFSDRTNRNSAVVFNETGRTSLTHN